MTGRDERALLAAARDGDATAFERLVGPRRTELRRHCARMLGSAEDAEDATQETMLRAWRALPRFEGRSSVRAWLYTIATNTCLNGIARRERVVPADDPAQAGGLELVGPRTPEGEYEEREAAELALATAIDELSPVQRDALILRDLLGCSAREAAAHLSTSVAAINSALQRARATARPSLAGDAAAGARGREAAVEYMTAIERGDVDGLRGLLGAPAAEDRHWTYAAAPAY